MGSRQSLPHEDTDTDSESNYRYPRHPTEDDVVDVRLTLLTRLPRELVDIIIDEAEYWVRACMGERVDNKSASDSASVCYMLTKPMPAESLDDKDESCTKRPRKMQRVIFTTTSHDQGWGGPPRAEIARYGPYHGSFSWFEACIVRFPDKDMSKDKTPLPSWIHSLDPKSSYFPRDGEINEGALSSALTVGPPPKRWCIHCNRTADRNYIQRTTVWSIDDEDTLDDYLLRGRAGKGREFLSLLRSGDRIAVIARAMFPGWVNHVQDASVDIVYSV